MINWEVLQNDSRYRSLYAHPKPFVRLVVGAKVNAKVVRWSLIIADDGFVHEGDAESEEVAKASAERAWKQWLLDALAEMEET